LRPSNYQGRARCIHDRVVKTYSMKKVLDQNKPGQGERLTDAESFMDIFESKTA
jgi:hypothetical protein